MAADEEEIGGGEDQEDAVDADDFRRPDDRREVAAGEAAERHAAAECHHVDAHDAATHLVRGMSCTSEVTVENTIIIPR